MKQTRRYDIDALRVIAFLLLIIYHIAMFYVADWEWHIKSEYLSTWLKFPMILLNQWRMPLLFLVSGIATSFLLRKLSASEFIKRRSYRLLLPFLVGTILIVPPQAYIQALANGSIAAQFGEMSYWQFLWHYFTFQAWPEHAFDGSEYGFTWNHLWFIPYLFFYTLLLLPFRVVLNRSKLGLYFNNIGKIALLIVPVLIQITWQLILNDEKPISHALIDDGYAHALFFTFFVLGYLISDQPRVWKVIAELRWFTLGAALISYSALISLWWVFNQNLWQDHLAGVVATFNQWFWVLAVLAWSARFLNAPAAWISYANKRVYPWYIFHQTITIIAGYYLARFSLGGLLESTLVCLMTVAGCWFATEIFVGRTKILMHLFGMK